jgi:tetratricopeptide (TPR) repeat protein
VSGYRAGEAQAWNALGILENDNRRADKAVTYLGQGLELLNEEAEFESGARADIEFNLVKLKVLALKGKDREEQRLTELTQFVKTHERYAPAVFELALILYRRDPRSKEAEAEFGKVCELAPQAPQGWRGLMETLLTQGRTAEASSTLQRAVPYLTPDAAGELRTWLASSTSGTRK